VVELDLICEYVFNKDGYDAIKPESIKKQVVLDQRVGGKVRMD